MITDISSTQNDRIKNLVQLQEKSRARKKSGLFVIEGEREIHLALESGFAMQQVYFCEEILGKDPGKAFGSCPGLDSTEWFRVSRRVYEHIAHRKKTEGIVAISRSKDSSLKDIRLGTNPLILIAEASEKPGNIGALLRTADAAQLDAVILANPLTDLYNPNIIRSSVGCLFTNQIATGSTGEILDFLRERGIRVLAAVLDKESRQYYQTDFTKPSAIVVGTEATGLSEEWLEQADEKIIIPMQGKIDSLNVSVSAAILIFEAKRQRKFQTEDQTRIT